MTKPTLIVTLALSLLIALTAGATSDVTLTFVLNDGSKVTYSTDGLKITYTDMIHAVIVNNETSGTLNLADLSYMYFGDENSLSITGDVNGDGEVNVADVNALIGIILGSETDEDTRSRADVNGDGEVNVADVNALIDLILNQ